jgi:hypothetical protein
MFSKYVNIFAKSICSSGTYSRGASLRDWNDSNEIKSLKYLEGKPVPTVASKEGQHLILLGYEHLTQKAHTSGTY